jgi:aldose sugar dehydrogenase
MLRSLPFLALALIASACNTGRVDRTAVERELPPAEVVAARVESEAASFRVVRVAGRLQNPWGLAFLPDGRMLVTERRGVLNLIDGERIVPVAGLPEIHVGGQGGLLDVVLHPDYAANGWIYFTYSAPGDGGAGTALARARLEGEALASLEVLYEMQQKTGRGQHFGSRIAFLPDGTLLLTIGDRGDGPRAQDPMDPAGSTIRLNDDGSIPADNPFVGREDALAELFTIGNRNSQGMAVHPETGAVWQTEHGPRGGDELNLIRPGQNYGWPLASFGADYVTRFQVGTRHDRTPQFVEPVTHWTPSIAPSGTMFYTGEAFPGWRGNLFVGALAYRMLVRVVLDGETVTHRENLLEGTVGRIRQVKQGPSGMLYLLTDEHDGGIYRMEPVR